MRVTDLSIQRPVLALVLNALLVVFGVLAFTQLPVRELPAVDPPVVSINTNYTGASAEVIESRVTRVIENAVSGIEGIRTIRSTSREGSSSVRIEFSLGRDIEAAANDVRDRVSRASRSLPDEVDAPTVAKVDSDANPILWATLTSDRLSPLELTDYARRVLVDRITAVPGVADVRVTGARDYAMRVWIDRSALAARGLTVQDIEDALERENAELPAGRLESRARELTVRTDTRLSTPEQFARLVISEGDGGPVRLGDVARVEVGAENERADYRVDGRTAVGLGVIRQATANTVEVSRDVRRLFDDMAGSMPEDARIDVSQDDSVFIAESIDEVFHALEIALILVVVVTWLFLRSLRATLIPALAIPVSIVATFAVIGALGFSINVLTLLALVLAIGLVVDDAIIVVENVSRRIEEGEPPLLAAFRGARQIGFAVIATTAVLVAAVLPLAMLQDTVGRMFREFAVTLAASVAFSAVVALTLTPMLCSQLLRAPKPPGALARASAKVGAVPARAFAWSVDAVLRAPLLFGVLLVALILACVPLFRGLPQEFTPPEDRGSFRISIDAPEGASVDYTKREMDAVQRILEPYRQGGEVTRVLAILNPGFGGASGVNRGFFNVRLAPWEERTRSAQAIMAELRTKLQAVPGGRVSAFAGGGVGRGASTTQVQAVLGGGTYEELAGLRDQVMDRLREDARFSTITSNYDETKPQLRVSIDRERAADLGLSVRDIGETLETLLGGRRATRFLERGQEYDVILQAGAEGRANPSDLANVFLRPDRSDRLVPLASVVRLTDVAASPELARFDRLRSITVTANLVEGVPLGDGVAAITQIAADVLPPEVRLTFDGAARDLGESGAAILFVFGMAMLVAFLVLAAQFESLVLPAVVMLTVPLALFGGLGAIAAAGMSLNIYTQIGLVLLIGLVAKNAILIVEFANQRRAEGLDIDRAVREAANLRVRPILMTSIATVLGAVPLMVAFGAGAEARSGIGTVIVGGVTVGTVLSLYATPLLYSLLARRVRPLGEIRRRIQELEGAHGHPADHPAE